MAVGYKVLKADGRTYHGTGRWLLPEGSKPGKWMPKIEDIELCKRGYHYCRDATDLIAWLGETIWIAEFRGEIKEGDDKAVAQEGRLIRKVDAWDEKSARLFSCACAKRALKYADPEHVETLRNTIRVAGAFARGKATEAELAAARSAAGAAAWAAAGASAGAAARAAARDAAWDAERKWQARKLKQMLQLEF